MKEEAEIRQMQLHTQGCQGSPATPEARRGEEDSPSEPPGATNPADVLIADFCLQNYETINFYCLKPPSFCKFLT